MKLLTETIYHAVTFCISLHNKIVCNSTTKMFQIFKGAILK
jgi:hypothetical protein